jgi:cob(I)alamin adenosyltransferase
MREEPGKAVEETVEDAGRELEARGAGYALSYGLRLVVGALEDLHSIARSVSVLPEIGQNLARIQQRVDSLDGEVRQMRAAVETIDEDVDGLEESLTAELRQTREGVLRVEQELGSAVHPLRRVTGRLSRRPEPGS